MTGREKHTFRISNWARVIYVCFYGHFYNVDDLPTWNRQKRDASVCFDPFDNENIFIIPSKPKLNDALDVIMYKRFDE